MEQTLNIGRVILTTSGSEMQLPYYEGAWEECKFRVSKLPNEHWVGNITKEGLIIFTPELAEPELVIAHLKKQIRELRIDFAAIFGTIPELRVTNIPR